MIGMVYNVENMLLYFLLGDKNKVGLKFDFIVGGGGYNEWVFDDIKG